MWDPKRAWISLKWMFLTVIAPEVLLSKNWADLKAARYNYARLRKFAGKDEVPGMLSHYLFANVGGFVLRTYAPGRVGTKIILTP